MSFKMWNIRYNNNQTFASAFMLRDSAIAERCVCYSNTCAYGTVYLRYGGTVRNSLIYHNTALRGGGTYTLTASGQSVGVVENCTIFENHATEQGGGVYLRENAIVRNSIVYNNTSPNGGNYALFSTTENDVDVHHTCTTPILPGEGNIDTDPLLLSPERGFYTIATDSPCRNTGTNYAWMSHAYDIEKRARIHELISDMGAYEYYAVPYIWLPERTCYFPNTPVTTSSFSSVPLHNLGDAALTASVLSINEPFASSTALTVVHAHTSIDLPLTFLPEAVSNYSQNVVLYSNDRDESFTLYGTGIPALQAVKNLLFGDVIVDSVATSTVSISNIGGRSITGSATGITAPFQLLSGSPYSIEPGESIELTCIFAPEQEVTYTDTLQLSGGGGITIRLYGTGIPEPSVIVLLIFIAAAMHRVMCSSL